MTREEAQRLREEELAGQAHGKDCFIIPQANLDRFLPDGVTLPRDPRKANNLINILEDQVEDPKIIVSFHLMGQLHPITPALANPLVNSLDVHFDLSKTLLSRAQSLNAGEGYIFKNLEKDADYPYINYYVINKSREEAGQFYTDNKAVSHDELNASKLGYHVAHTMDLYDEVATMRLRRLPDLRWIRRTRDQRQSSRGTSSASTRCSKGTTVKSLRGTGCTGQVHECCTKTCHETSV